MAPLQALTPSDPAPPDPPAAPACGPCLLQVEALDYALRQKNQASASEKLPAVQIALDNVLAAVL